MTSSLPVRPHMMWVIDVEREAGAIVPAGDDWKRRLRLWHDSGESVTSAAKMLKFMVERIQLDERSWQSEARRTIQKARRS